MKKLALGALLVGLLVACGGGGDSKKVVIVDSGGPDGPTQCNPLTQAGCAAGEKCTWLLDALMPQYVGHIGCAPDGAKNADEACMYGAPGATGYDDCKKGLVCGNYRGGAGVCKTICDQQGGAPMCDAAHVCVTYSGLFSTGAMSPSAGGVCDLACDPLQDNDFDGSGTTLTGTADARRKMTCGTNAQVGCYGYPSFGTPPATGWSCTGDIKYTVAQPTGLRHRVQCTEATMCADPGPTIYVNSCNQGYLPLLRESTMVSTAICVALCKPSTCYNNNNCGTNNVNRIGASDDGCRLADRVSKDATFNNANDADGGEHCVHGWWFEIDDQGNFLQSATSDTIGYCYNHEVYLYDTDANNMGDAPLPNCGNLGSGTGPGSDPLMPNTYWGALDLGCVPSTFIPMMADGKQRLPESAMKRRQQVDFPRALYRRTMGTPQ
jgi:hypothetical protein